MDMRSQTQVASGLNVIAGVWLIVSPWVLHFSANQTAMIDAVVVGIVVGVLALVHAFATMRATWLSWVNAIVAIWLFVSPWVLGFSTDTTPFWNALVLGAIVFVLSVVAGYSATRTPVGAAR